MPRRAPLLPLTLLFVLPAQAATIWTGPTILFEKAPYADPTLPENQDAIAPGIAITRGDVRGLYNAALESEYVDASPLGTEWAFPIHNEGLEVSAVNHAALQFEAWADAVGRNPTSSVGLPGVLHLIDLDIYLDITFTNWGGGAGGGGAFAYQRATSLAVPEPSTASLLAMGLAGWLGGRRHSSRFARRRSRSASSMPSPSRR